MFFLLFYTSFFAKLKFSFTYKTLIVNFSWIFSHKNER